MKFTKKILDNGLTVLHEKRDVDVTTVMLAAKYGAAYETIEEKGMAHFMEHLCFKGTEKRTAEEIAKQVEGLGGHLNAFTHEEVTAYHVRLPSKHLDMAMDVISDIFFNATFPEEEFEKEANVICEEIKMYRDNPRSHVIENIKKSLYEKPFGSFIAGSEETVKSLTRKKLFERHRQVYVPKNSILCVVGNNNIEEVIKLAEKFSVEREGKKIEIPNIKLINEIKKESREGITQANLAIGIHLPYKEEKMRAAAEVFSSILGGGMSSKLFTEVREKKGLVYGIRSDVDLGKNYGYMLIWAGTENSKVEEVYKICEEEFSKMGNITLEELEAGKTQLIGNKMVESESSNDVAINLIMEEINGDAKQFYEYEKKINEVTLEEIKNLSKISEFSKFCLGE